MTATARTRWPHQAGFRIKHVGFYGAVGDGTTDDTTALQAAWDACSDGDTLYLDGTKTYRTTAQLNFIGGRVGGPTLGRVAIAGNGATISRDFALATHTVVYGGALGAATWMKYGRIDDLAIVRAGVDSNEAAPWAGDETETGGGLVFQNCGYCSFRNLTVWNHYIGICFGVADTNDQCSHIELGLGVIYNCKLGVTTNVAGSGNSYVNAINMWGGRIVADDLVQATDATTSINLADHNIGWCCVGQTFENGTGSNTTLVNIDDSSSCNWIAPRYIECVSGTPTVTIAAGCGSNVFLGATGQGFTFTDTGGTSILLNGAIIKAAAGQWQGPFNNTAVNSDYSQITVDDSSNNTIAAPLRVWHYLSGGNGANGIGAALVLGADTSTSDKQEAARVVGKWVDATHNSRTGQLDIIATDNAASRTIASFLANGSAPAMSVFGATPAVQTANCNAASDLATVITLANTLRTLVIGHGFMAPDP